MKREHLIQRLRALGQSTAGLIRLSPREQGEFRPAEGMRSLSELLDHLAAQPLVDLAVLQESPRPVAETIEETLHSARPEEWAEIFLRGIRAAEEYFSSMSEEEFEERVTRAHYGTAHPQCVWLLDLIGHLYHHRGQLYLYLQLLGAPVGVEHLYT